MKKLLILLTIFLLSLTGCTSQEDPSNPDPAQEQKQESTKSTNQKEEQSTETDQEAQQEEESVSVSVNQSSSSNGSFYIDLLGTVEAKNNVNVYPATAGQINAVNVQEGDAVNKGDIIFVLGGSNGAEHQSVTQYKIAKANYDVALSAYNSSVKSANVGVKSAELQLQSAQHQTEGYYIDYNAFANNIEAMQDTIGLTRVSLGETSIQNDRNLRTILDGIDDLEDAIDELKDERREAVLDLEEQIDNTFDKNAKQELIALLETTKDGFDTQIDALEKQIDELENQYDSAKSGGVLTENQILGQLQQAETQLKSLYMTRDSTEKKLGLENGISDPVLLAQQGVEAAKAQSEIAVTQAKAQRDLAKINLDSAYNLQQQLLVQAPVSGTIGEVDFTEGDTVAPQNILTEVISEKNYVLKVGVDIANADKIDLTKNAEILIGGQYIRMPIQRISPIADEKSRLVTVTVDLPKINFRSNQTLNVKLPLRSSNGSSQTGSTLLIPLDAVIIGTEEQFVYIAENGKAKKVDVTLGEINGDMVEVLDGLSSTQNIIVDGAKDLTEGQSITIK
jgi:RND family efflux transporter MFP subunit